MRIAVVTRVKDEPYIEAFVRYYLAEGVDHIYLLDDYTNKFTDALRRVAAWPQVTVLPASETWPSNSDSWTQWNLSNDAIRLLFQKRRISDSIADLLSQDPLRAMYLQQIAPQYDWLINVDADEFMLPNAPVRLHELLTTVFAHVDCVMCPWLQFGFNNREHDPPNLLHDNARRMDISKALRQFDEFNAFGKPWEIALKSLAGAACEPAYKCMFRPSAFALWMDHAPALPIRDVTIYNALSNRAWKVAGVDLHNVASTKLFPLRKLWKPRDVQEINFQIAPVICAHYRLYSHEHLRRKIETSNNKRKKRYQPLLLLDPEQYDSSNVLDFRMRFRLREPWHRLRPLTSHKPA